jgi:hypothetical protein
MLAPSKQRLILRDIFLVVCHRSQIIQNFLLWLKAEEKKQKEELKLETG